MKIIWSNEAKITYEEIIDDLLIKWPIDIALDFENRTNNLLNQLILNKQLCPPINHSQFKKLRKCVIHKNASLIYLIKSKNIHVVTFVFNQDEHPFY
jgi:hypothetical protein